MRLNVGYFAWIQDSKPGALVFNRTVGLKDSWQKVAAKEEGEAPAAKAEPAKAEAAKAPAPTPTIPANLAVPEAHPNFKELAPEITIDEFLKVDLRVAIIRHAEAVPEADKLLRLLVDVGEGRLRQIPRASRRRMTATIIGSINIANLKPRQMKFGLSEGMLPSPAVLTPANWTATHFGDRIGRNWWSARSASNCRDWD